MRSRLAVNCAVAAGVDSTSRDSAAVRRVAAAAFQTDSATIAAAKLEFKGDTALVKLASRVSTEAVRVVRRNGQWVWTGERILWIR